MKAFGWRRTTETTLRRKGLLIVALPVVALLAATAWSNVIVGLVVALTGIAGADRLFARGIVRRLHLLERNTRLLASGRVLEPMPQTRDELGRASAALVEAAGILAASREQIAGAHTRLARIVAASPAVIFTLRPGDLHPTFVSENFREFTGYEPARVLESFAFWADRVHAEDLPVIMSGMSRFYELGRKDSRFRFLCADGSYRWFQSELRLVRDDAGEPLEVVGSWMDVDDSVRSELALEATQERFARVFESSPIGMGMFDLAGRFLQVNPALCRMTGYGAAELIGRDYREITHAEERERDTQFLAAGMAGEARTLHLEKRFVRSDGSEVWCAVAVTVVNDADGQPGYFFCHAQDISGRKRFEEQLVHRAHHDGLTGLPNRLLVLDRLAHALDRLETVRTHVGVVVLDLDRFKVINDSLGHDVGDALLLQVAERLRAMLRPGDTLGRFGGDEFVVICEDVPSASGVASVATRVLESFREPFLVGDRELVLTASVGSTVAEAPGVTADELLRDADGAMYRAKHAGGARHKAFDGDLRAELVARLDLEADLRAGIENDELRLQYQPQVDLGTGRILGVEALVRWEHPERGLLAPGVFIALAEEVGLIVPLGRWVLRRALADVAAWSATDPAWKDITVSVNLSARQLDQPDLLDEVAAMLRESDVAPGRVCLEITESLLMDDAESAIESLIALRSLGVKLAVDDFGTRHSSLGRLKHFPCVDEIKVDRSFVGGLGKSAEDEAVVRAVVALAHSLGAHVVAEGVETTEQSFELRALGCERAQGFLYARPMDPAAIRALVRDGVRLPAGMAQAPSTILIVDDDPGVLMVARRTLETLGYQVLEAGTARDALDLLCEGKEHINTLITDVVMPEMWGTELAAAAIESRPDLKVVYMSAAPAVARHSRALHPRAALVPKPFTKDSLLEALGDEGPDPDRVA